MKQEKRTLNEKIGSKGITLIALVVTIIVLLILAGISIQMLTGQNGILKRAGETSTKTTHARVLEQMQLETSTYLIDKSIGKYSNNLIDYLKSKSIISDISGEEDKWQINVTTLLGTNESTGRGTYPNDVYVLEKQNMSEGSLLNTKVATTTFVRISRRLEDNFENNQEAYDVIYYDGSSSNKINVGKVVDNNSSSVAVIDESAKLSEYFTNGTSYSEDGFENIEPIMDAKENLRMLYNDGEGLGYVQYRNLVYKIQSGEDGAIASLVNIDLTRAGEQTLDGKTVLITPNSEYGLVHFKFKLPEFLGLTEATFYYLKENGIDLDLSRVFTGNVYQINNHFCNNAGEVINVAYVHGPDTFSNVYYLKENGEIDENNPFTNGYDGFYGDGLEGR